MEWFKISLAVVMMVGFVVTRGEVPKSLCHVPGCQCDVNVNDPALVDVVCNCETKMVSGSTNVFQ